MIAGSLGAACPTASGQERVHKWFGDQSLEQFGESLSTKSDFTGDGIPDVVIGAPAASTDLGMVRAFSGSDGSIAWTLFGNSGDGLGHAVSILGDVDHDGVEDFMVTTGNPPNANPHGLGITLYSGATRLPLYTVLGDTNETLGNEIIAMGDVDGDGVTDCAVSSFGGVDIRVISGSSGASIQVYSPPSDAGIFGYSISSGGDVDGDGVQDLLVGDPYALPGGKPNGAAWVYSGASGTLLYELAGAVKNSYFGNSVAIIHDVNFDGLADIAVGSPNEVDSGGSGGHARVFSGTNGTPLLNTSLPGYQPFSMAFGNVVADAGDVNRDGYGDFFVQQGLGGEYYDPYSILSVVHLISGRDGAQIYHYFDTESDIGGFGFVVQLSPDLDGDGNPEVAISCPQDDSGGFTFPGSASVWRIDDLFVDAVPRVAKSGISTVSITVGQGIAGSPYALFLVDFNGSPVSVPIALGLLDVTGRAILSGQAPAGLQGYSFGFKAFALDVNLRVIGSGVETMSFQ